MDYNVTVELDGRLTDAERSDVLDALIDAGLHPAIGDSGYDSDSVTVTVDDLENGELDEAVARALSSIAINVYPKCEVRAVTALPTELFDQRFVEDGPNMLAVAEAASRLKVSEQRVRQLLTEGKLEGEKVGRDWIVSARSVQDRIEQRG